MFIQKSKLMVAAVLYVLLLGHAGMASAAAISSAPAQLNGALANSTTNQTITISGGSVSYPTMSVTNFQANGTGLLNTSVTFDTNAGTFTVNGTPTSAGTASFTINVTDSMNAMFTQNYTLSVFS